MTKSQRRIPSWSLAKATPSGCRNGKAVYDLKLWAEYGPCEFETVDLQVEAGVKGGGIHSFIVMANTKGITVEEMASFNGRTI